MGLVNIWRKWIKEFSGYDEAQIKRALGVETLVGADLREVKLRWADLREADLRGADLGGAKLRGADLGGADLRGADLRGAELDKGELRGAKLEGARNVTVCQLSEAIVDDTTKLPEGITMGQIAQARSEVAKVAPAPNGPS